MKKRGSFLLLEILLAIAMIGLAEGIILSTPVNIFKKHLEELEHVELSRVANNLIVDIEQKLTKKHTWISLLHEKKDLFFLEDVEIDIPSILHKKYKCAYHLWIKRGDKEGDGSEVYRLLACNIYFVKEKTSIHWETLLSGNKKKYHKFSYRIFVSATQL